MRLIALFIALAITSPLYSQTENDNVMDSTKSERFQRGWEKLREIDGHAGVNVIESLKDISPDLGRYIIEYPFGDVYHRDILDHRSKEIAVVAALTAMGNAHPQLKVYLHAALNVGISAEELTEIMILMSVYAGFPASLNGTMTLKEVLEERKAEIESSEQGLK